MSNRKRACGTGSGFTLIELLVVISIIALLLSILTPSLSKVKEQAKSIVGRSNLRTLGLATLLYAQDFENILFAYGSGLYLNQISPYAEGIDESRYCPATRIDETIDYTAWGTAKIAWTWNSGTPEPEHGSFAMNGWLYSYPQENIQAWRFVGEDEVQTHAFHSLSQVRRNQITPIFADSIWVDSWPRYEVDGIKDTVLSDHDLEYGSSGADWPVNNHIRREIINRHNGDCNIIFVDGHADSIPLKKLWSLKWNRQFDVYSGDMLRDDDTPIYK